MKKKLFLTAGILALATVGSVFYYQCNTTNETQPIEIEENLVHLIPETKTVDTSVVLYENKRGLVTQTRRDTLKKGLQDISFGIISPELILPSVTVSGKSIQMQTQNFDPKYEDKSYYELAQEQAIGREVTLLWSVWKEGALTEIKKKAKLLAVENRTPILLIDGVVHKGTDAKILYPEPIADTKQKNATLDFTVVSDTDKEQDVTLSFLTGGFSWDTNYIVTMDNKTNDMNLKGYVTLRNNSGVNYKNTSVDFVLGDFNITSTGTTFQREKAQCEIDQQSGIKTGNAPITVNGRIIEQIQSNGRPYYVSENGSVILNTDGSLIGRVATTNIIRDLKDYYVYHLPFKTTLNTGKTVQALFLEYPKLPYEKEYVFNIKYNNSGTNLPPDLYLIFDNQKDAGVGMPLPKGTFRVFNNSNGQSFFVGEANVNDTLALGQKARLNVGEALDVYANLEQINMKETSDTQKEITYSMRISNVSDENKKIVINRSIYEPERLILNSDIEYTGFQDIQWALTVPAGEVKTFTWTEQVNDIDLIRKRKELEIAQEKKQLEEDRLSAEKERRKLKYGQSEQKVRLVIDN